jgi:hypothetical protein
VGTCSAFSGLARMAAGRQVDCRVWLTQLSSALDATLWPIGWGEHGIIASAYRPRIWNRSIHVAGKLLLVSSFSDL